MQQIKLSEIVFLDGDICLHMSPGEVMELKQQLVAVVKAKATSDMYTFSKANISMLEIVLACLENPKTMNGGKKL